MKTESEIVARQYHAWVYPQPIDDLEKAIQETHYHDYGDPALIRRKIWPRKVEPDALEILVAGCGANQAAYLAYKNPNCHIVGIDISENSLGHQKFLKQKHGLKNLDLYLMSLGDVAKLGQMFDYVVSTGVLHHLPDPEAGLRCLREVLVKPHGVMHIALYGQYRRAGVYMLQEVFRTLGVQQTPEGVALVKATLAALPPNHHVQSYLTAARDLGYDSGLVDTFLHPQDRAYTVPQLMAFARDNGLKFQAWTDNVTHSVEALLGREHPLYAHIKSQPEELQWHLLDLLTHQIGFPMFFLCHPERPEHDYRLDFSATSSEAPWLDYRPIVRAPVTVVEKANQDKNTPAVFERNGQTFRLGYQAAVLFASSKGAASIREVLEAQPWFQANPVEGVEVARQFYAQMADWDHLMFEIP